MDHFVKPVRQSGFLLDIIGKYCHCSWNSASRTYLRRILHKYFGMKAWSRVVKLLECAPLVQKIVGSIPAQTSIHILRRRSIYFVKAYNVRYVQELKTLDYRLRFSIAEWAEYLTKYHLMRWSSILPWASVKTNLLQSVIGKSTRRQGEVLI